MKEIPLTQGKDDGDYDAVMQFKWYAQKRIGGEFNAARNVRRPDGTRYTQLLHQFLMPGVPMIDHRDGNPLNYQRYNLRPCTRCQNMANRKPNKNGASRFLGVSWHPGARKWTAIITSHSKRYILGYFVSEEDAARAYDTAALKYHGDFARLNFPVHNTTQLPS